MDETATPVKRPRFPYLAAALCAACLGAAAWMWMRYSWAWDVTDDEIAPELEPEWDGWYVSLRGVYEYPFPLEVMGPEGWVIFQIGHEKVYIHTGHDDGTTPRALGPFRVVGRTRWRRWNSSNPGLDVLTIVDITASRFTWQSISGLVVGATGLLVFALYLRRWVKERRAGPT